MNRRETVGASIMANFTRAGHPIHELIHVDNGSEPGFCEWFKEQFQPAIQISHRENLGVSRGYNRGLTLATGSHMVITGCDRLMPKGWLYHFNRYFEAIPHTGVISVYSGPGLDQKYRDRLRGEVQIINGVPIQRAIPFEARCHSREFWLRTGVFREDFGLYGLEDCEWASRAERVAGEEGWLNYVIPGFEAHHSNDDDAKLMPDGKTYREWKDSLITVDSRELWHECSKSLYPYYNPYSRIERPLRGKPQ